MSTTARPSLVKMLIKNKINQQQHFHQQTQKSCFSRGTVSSAHDHNT